MEQPEVNQLIDKALADDKMEAMKGKP